MKQNYIKISKEQTNRKQKTKETKKQKQNEKLDNK